MFFESFLMYWLRFVINITWFGSSSRAWMLCNINYVIQMSFRCIVRRSFQRNYWAFELILTVKIVNRQIWLRKLKLHFLKNLTKIKNFSENYKAYHHVFLLKNIDKSFTIDLIGCRIRSTYPNPHAKVKKLISDVQFPENRFELGMIKNNFWSSIWDIQI